MSNGLQSGLSLEDIKHKLHNSLILSAEHPSSAGKIWFDHPSFLYATNLQVNTYISLMDDEKYAKPVHDPIKAMFAKYRKEILDSLEPPIDIIDLGPGYPDITFPILDYISSERVPSRYIPVDISTYFLDIATNVVKRYKIKTIPVHSSFEDFPDKLSSLPFNQARSRLIILGITFLNYRPTSILSLLKKMCRTTDAIVVANPDIERNSSKLIAPYYSSGAEKLNALIIELLGLETRLLKYNVVFENNRIEMGFVVLKSFNISNKLKLIEGQKIITAISYRYESNQFRYILNKKFAYVRMFESDILGIDVAKCQIVP